MLQDKLNAMKAASAEKIPPEIGARMQQTTADLSNSDILQQVIKTGDRCPDFSLANANGNQVDLATLRQQGPVLLSLYRGVW
jgi:hypothetical protein